MRGFWRLLGYFTNSPDIPQLVIGENAGAGRGLRLVESSERVIADVASVEAPIEEDFCCDENMRAFTWGFYLVELSRGLGIGDFGQLASESHAAEFVAVAVDGRGSASMGLVF
jgi:hypothetical protein